MIRKVNAIDSDQKHLEKKIEDVDKKRADTSKCFLTQDFNRLTKINFNTRIKEALKKKSFDHKASRKCTWFRR